MCVYVCAVIEYTARQHKAFAIGVVVPQSLCMELLKNSLTNLAHDMVKQ